MQNPMETFEFWLLHRVAEAVEAGEISADLLIDLRREMERPTKRSQEKGHALAVGELAERLSIPMDRMEEMRAALEALPAATRTLLVRRLAAAWLAGKRGQSQAEEGGS